MGEDERGESLVEILVALAVLGIGITALLGALTTNITATGINRSQAQAATTLLSAAEHVKSLTSVACGAPAVGLPPSVVPHDVSLFTVTYGPAVAFNASTPCSELRRVPVRVVGDGFDLTLDVVQRP